jgi:gamma-glutamylcyclotransferase (GGCT)/AIG2-like uncharacterized protein YtfP
MARLFSYGTLQQREVQLASFGRVLDGEADALPGYRLEVLEITDPSVVELSGKTHHPILRPSENPDDEVAGTVFKVTEAELAAADAYEVADYVRVNLRLQSGAEAWVYVQQAV